MSNYRTMHTDEGCRIAVEGGLTSLLVPDLQQVVRAEVRKGAREITFDLQDTGTVDSSGIGLLIAAFNTLSRTNGTLAVINTAPEILNLLRSLRVASRLNISGRPGPESDHE